MSRRILKRSCASRNLFRTKKHGQQIFIQIGAGAGDQDPRANWRDGFSEFVKRQSLTSWDRIIVVEPNPLNEGALRHAWRNFPQVEIHLVGIVPDPSNEGQKTFWYAEEDAPHFQVFSLDRDHVRRHYPHSQIAEKLVKCVAINNFIAEVVEGDSVELLAIDVEGVDAELLMAVDWNRFQVRAVSFESMHSGAAGTAAEARLRASGFVAAGFGLDPSGYDRLFVRPADLLDVVRFGFWELGRKLSI